MTLLLIIYFIILLVISISISISEPLTAEDSGIVTVIKDTRVTYIEISKDFDSLLPIVKALSVVFIMVNVFIIYVMCWSMQGKFLLRKGWR